MDENNQPTTPDDAWAVVDEGSLKALRTRARSLLAAQDSQLGRLEQDLTTRLDEIAAEIERETQHDRQQLEAASTSAKAFEAAAQQLAHRETELEQARLDLHEARLAIAKCEQDRRIHESLLAQAEQQQAARRIECAAVQEQLAAANDQLAALTAHSEAALSARVEPLEQKIASADEELDRLRKHLESSRIANAKLKQELRIRESLLTEAQSQEVATRLEVITLQDQLASLRSDHAAGTPVAPIADHSAQLTALQAQLVEQVAESQRLREGLEQSRVAESRLEQELRIRDALVTAAEAKESAARLEFAALEEQLAQARAQAATPTVEVDPALIDKLEQQQAQLARLADDAELLRLELQESRTACGRLEQERRIGETLLKESESREAAARRECAAAQEALAAAQDRVAADNSKQLRQELEESRTTCARLEQDRRIGEALLHESEAREATTRGECVAAQEALAAAQDRMAAGSQSAAKELTAQLESLRHQLSEQSAQLDRVRDDARSAREAAIHSEQELHASEQLLAEAERRKAAQELERSAVQEQLTAARLLAVGAQAAQVSLEAQMEPLRTLLASRTAELERLQGELEQARIAQLRLQQDQRIAESLATETESRLEAARKKLATAEDRLADALAQLECAQRRQNALREELHNERQQGSAARDGHGAARTRIARRLKSRRAKQRIELEKLRAASQTLEGELANLRDEARSLKAAAAETASQPEHSALDEQLAGLQAQNEAAQIELEELRKKCATLSERLAAAEAKAAQQGKSAPDARKREDLSRRLELALEELRETKKSNSELEAKLLKARTASAAAGSNGAGSDWESQKQRMLAALAKDEDEEDSEERVTIEGTIRITDQIIAHKDAEIAELKRMLEEQSSGMGSIAVGAAAVADLLDRDELVRQERERLHRAEAEWREKIGQAEIDLSVERAKFARERAELEEKARVFQQDVVNRDTPSDPRDGGKPVRGRWLARLGLKDLEEGK